MRRRFNGNDNFSAGDVEVRGKEIPIFVDSEGKFIVEIGGETYSAPTKNGLRSKLLSITRKSINVPIVYWDYGILKKGAVIGQHGSNRNYLIKWDGEKGAGQEYNLDDYYNLTEKQLAEYVRLQNISAAADKAVANFEAEHKGRVRQMVLAALGTAKEEVDI
jgi:hypothetical protein